MSLDLFEQENFDPVSELVKIANLLEAMMLKDIATPGEINLLTKINKELSPYAISAHAEVLQEVSDSVHTGLSQEELIAVERLMNNRIKEAPDEDDSEGSSQEH
jgi:hypothetical protein